MPRTVEGVILRSGERGHTGQIMSKEAVVDMAKKNNWKIRDGSDGQVEAVGTVLVYLDEFKLESFSLMVP